MIGKSFHATSSTSDVDGTDVDSVILVGAGVMGEKGLGFGVAVGCDTGAASRAMSRSVGVLAGIPCCGVGVCVGFALQEVANIHTRKIGTHRRFIWQSIAGKN
jgi:hypothetical protein